MDIENIITYIKNKIETDDFKRSYRQSNLSFCHDCDLTFSAVMKFVLCNNKSTLGIEALNFSEVTGRSHYPSAFSRARQKIKYEAFADILQDTSDKLPKKNLYKGYQLVAFDGTEFQLPKTEKLSKYYQQNISYPVGHLIAKYDVLNKLYLDAEVVPYPADERSVASTLLSRNKGSLPQIFLNDRGFPSVALIKRFNDLGLNYVFRVSKSFLKEVNEFTFSEKTEEIVNVDYTKRRIKSSKTKLEEPYSFILRLAKIALLSGENEILITNLDDNFSISDLYELYGLRWGIETSFNYLKNSTMFERFFSLHENSIKQEIYASLIQQNLATVIAIQADEAYKKNDWQGIKILLCNK